MTQECAGNINQVFLFFNAFITVFTCEVLNLNVLTSCGSLVCMVITPAEGFTTSITSVLFHTGLVQSNMISNIE